MGSEVAALRASTALVGAWQMAIDDWLLAQRQPAFRFYRWSQPTLSLGFHQRHLQPQWLEMARRGELALVRRSSGGGAVLHAGGLTYALVWPDPPCSRPEAYRQACHWLQQAFDHLAQPLAFGTAPAAAGGRHCFSSSTAADLVHANGSKRVGSAQLWRQGCLLQHGEILLTPPADLWQAAFATAPPSLPPLGLSSEALEGALLAAARAHLPFALGAGPIPWRAAELAAIAADLGRYRLDPDGAMVSPEACMDRTTWGRARPRG